MSRMRRWIPSLMLCLGLSACSPQPELTALPEDGVILAYGDSLTYGTGAPSQSSYPVVLAGLSGYRVVNAGVPGEESDAGLERLPEVLEAVSPDLVILGHGGNDILRQRDLARTEANLRDMATLAREQGAQVVLLGIPKPGIFIDTHPLYPRLAEALEVPIEDEALADILSDAALKSDTIHPNAEGYRRLAMALLRLLNERGAL